MFYVKLKKYRNKYQPSGAGGTHSPPAPLAKSKMANRLPQNGQRGQERVYKMIDVCVNIEWVEWSILTSQKSGTLIEDWEGYGLC